MGSLVVVEEGAWGSWHRDSLSWVAYDTQRERFQQVMDQVLCLVSARTQWLLVIFLVMSHP